MPGQAPSRARSLHPEGLGHPLKGLLHPLKDLVHPLEGLGHPLKGFARPFSCPRAAGIPSFQLSAQGWHPRDIPPSLRGFSLFFLAKPSLKRTRAEPSPGPLSGHNLTPRAAAELSSLVAAQKRLAAAPAAFVLQNDCQQEMMLKKKAKKQH